MLENLKIGIIVKAQGIKGQVKVQPLTDDISRFSKLKETIIDGKTYRVLNAVIGGGMVFLTLSGITDRNTAETFRGKFLYVTRENAVPLEEGRYFIADIIGCDLITDQDQKVGKIIDVTPNRTDVITVQKLDGKIMRFPFLKDLVINVDILGQTMTVSAKRLAEVSVDEN